MFPGQMFNPAAFQNVSEDGGISGFSFEMKLQYYRGVSLSIIRNIEVEVDGELFPKNSIRFSVNDETFTLEEMRTVISNRWRFGQFARVTILIKGGLAPGKHTIKCTQTIAPSYMPFLLVESDTEVFVIGEEAHES